MTAPRPHRPSRGTSIAVALATLLLTGCALIQPPPVPSVPRLGQLGVGGAACGTSISRAHAALAGVGAAAGDPAATAAAHAMHAAAMSEYHGCLAQHSLP